METILLIDGENFKGKMKSIFKEAGKERPVWYEYDFKGLSYTTSRTLLIRNSEVFKFENI